MTKKATTCTIGPYATTGERCGKPAVYTFTGMRGEAFGECAEHYAGYPVGRPIGEHFVGEVVPVHRYGKTYYATVTEIGKRGAVYAEFTYGNGAKRRVRV
jgi:hypothetical protein